MPCEDLADAAVVFVKFFSRFFFFSSFDISFMSHTVNLELWVVFASRPAEYLLFSNFLGHQLI